jgi:hypothetical protein
MDPIPVNSTLLIWVLYVPEEGRLRLKFRSGEVYDYSLVPEDIYQALLAADSKGRYFNLYIRDAYPTQQLKIGAAT